MTVFRIDINSSLKEVNEFYSLYVEAYKNLCIWKGYEVINLSEYLKPSVNIKKFIDDLVFIIKSLGFIIYYTHNDDVITSIAFIQIDELTHCYAKLQFLCGNETTREEKIDGKSQGIYMLDYIFNTYKDYIILIEPATPDLIPYYTKYKKPCFTYDVKSLKETYGYLIYGNLSMLKERCFENIFKSIKTINKMITNLRFNSLNDLYNNTKNLTSLKEKLITKLDFLVKTKELKADNYEQLLDSIIDIKFYDIQDIIEFSKNYERSTSATLTKNGGKIKTIKTIKTKKMKTTKNKKTKMKTTKK
jgi:hypothetical protein